MSMALYLYEVYVYTRILCICQLKIEEKSSLSQEKLTAESQVMTASREIDR